MEIAQATPDGWIVYARPALYGLVALWGVLNCLRGYRLFRTLFAVMTAFAGAAGGLELARLIAPGEVGWAVGGLFLGLILGGVLAGFGFRLATFALGAYAGFMTAAPLVALMETESYRLGILAAAVAGGGIAAVLLARPVIILATAMIGGFQVVFSVAYFLGGADWLGWVFDPSRPLIVSSSDPMLALVSVGVGCVGAIVQSRQSAKKRKTED